MLRTRLFSAASLLGLLVTSGCSCFGGGQAAAPAAPLYTPGVVPQPTVIQAPAPIVQPMSYQSTYQQTVPVTVQQPVVQQPVMQPQVMQQPVAQPQVIQATALQPCVCQPVVCQPDPCACK